MFCPTESEMKKCFWEKQRHPFIRSVKGTKPTWNSFLNALEGHGGRIRSVTFSQDGTMLASASDDSTVRLWNPATGAQKQTSEGHESWVTLVTFSQDGMMLASASGDSTVRIWDPATGVHKQTLEGHSSTVRSVTFSQDGTMLASASCDSTVRLWDPATGAHKQTFEGHKDCVNSIVGSGEGTPALLVTEEWIVRDSELLLWLPVDYRASTVVVLKSIIVLGHKFGGMTIIEITDKEG
jgi:WD40 repeat protein